jgi:hypothetical protein
MLKGSDDTPLAVATIAMSVVVELKAVPVLFTVAEEPFGVKVIMLEPLVTLQVVLAPPDEFRVMLVEYPDGVWLLTGAPSREGCTPGRLHQRGGREAAHAATQTARAWWRKRPKREEAGDRVSAKRVERLEKTLPVSPASKASIRNACEDGFLFWRFAACWNKRSRGV